MEIDEDCVQITKRGLQSCKTTIGQQLRSHVQFAVVIDKSHFSELVHEVCDPRTSCAYHFRQSFMTEQRDLCVRHELGLAQPGQFQEYTGQPLFAVVEVIA